MDIQSKSMMNNLVIGGIDEEQNETPIMVENAVKQFLIDDLEIPTDKVESITFDRLQRTGKKFQNKIRKIVVVFKDAKDKEFVKTHRAKLENTQKFMHDQYPPEIVTQRRNLVPILVKAKKDNKLAYIRYNKLIIDGREYTNGVYGKVPQ